MNDVEASVQRQLAYDLEIEAQIAAAVRRRRIVIGVMAAILIGLCVVFGIRLFDTLNEPQLGVEDHLSDADQAAAKRDHLATVKSLKRLLALEPEHSEARARLAEAYLSMGDGVTAAKELAELGRLGFSASKVGSLRNLASLWNRQYTGVLVSVVTEDPTSDTLMVQGDANLGLLEFDKATLAFEKLLEMDSNSSEAKLGLVRLALGQHDVEQARDWVDAVLQSDPANLEAVLLSAVVALEEGNYPVAQSLFERGQSETVGGSPASLLGLVQTHFAQGRNAEAESILKTIPGHFRKHPDVAYLRAVGAIRRGDVHEARTLMLDLLKYRPDHTDSIMLLVRTAYEDQDFGQARVKLQRVLDRSPSLGQPQLLMGMVQLQMGDAEAARSTFRNVIDSDPENPQAYILLSRALSSMNDPDGAQKALATANVLAQEQGVVQVNTADLVSLAHAWNLQYCRVLVRYCANCLFLRECL